MKNRLGLAEMKLNQFTLPVRMANKAACWDRNYRTLQPKGRLSHAWNRRFKSKTHTRERELLQGGEQSQTFSLVPQHYLSSVHFPPVCHSLLQKELQNLFHNERSSRPGWSGTLFPHITEQMSQVFFFFFSGSIALFGFLCCATQFSLNEGMSMTFQTYSMVLPITD